MQPIDTRTILFRHHLWANLRLLEHCAELTDEQLDSTISGVYGSIRDTLRQIIIAEQSYLHRIHTGRPRPRTDNEMTMSIAEMIESARSSDAGLIEWAPQVQAEDRVY